MLIFHGTILAVDKLCIVCNSLSADVAGSLHGTRAETSPERRDDNVSSECVHFYLSIH